MLRKLLAGIVVALAVLALVEASLRLIAGPPPPPVAVFQVKGEVENYLELTAQTARPTYQLLEEISPFSRTAGGAAVLGGSSVHIGRGQIETPDEFAGLLAKRLGVPFANLGAPGLDSFDLASIMAELSAVDLDLLIVYTGHNDLGNLMFQQRYGDLVGEFSAAVLPIVERTQLFSQLRRALGPPAGTAHPEKPHIIRRDRSLRPTAAQRSTAARFFTTNLARIVWTAQRRGLPLILVVPASNLLAPPARDPCQAEKPCAKTLWQHGVHLNQQGELEEGLAMLQQVRDIDPVTIRASSAIEAAIRSFANEPGVTVIDAAADLPRMDGQLVPHSQLFEDAIHFSPAGHAAMADLLEPAARELLQHAIMSRPEVLSVP
ncbi:MAG: SGNH/GDSL hydrolase family protein [Myxococcota bacterium]|nr:SGNH/GDSL hydrolase family protein [Myxococcota bacterium]